jgi:hypothetical protein
MTRIMRLARLALLLQLALPFAGCGTSGEECDTCSSDDGCKSGLVCSTFDDGSKRCGTGSGTSCRVR